MEVRVQGKLPERRSNHSAFVACVGDQEYLYVHGGRDIKVGSLESMWRVSITGIRELITDSYYPVGWESVSTEGRGLGKISHHTASVQSATEVLFYGGLLGEDSNT